MVYRLYLAIEVSRPFWMNTERNNTTKRCVKEAIAVKQKKTLF